MLITVVKKQTCLLGSESSPGSESSREHSFPGTKVPENFCSRERKFPGTFAPGSESSQWELSLRGAKIPRSEKSWYLCMLKPRLCDVLARRPYSVGRRMTARQSLASNPLTVLVLQTVQSVNVEQNRNQLNIFCYDARYMRKHGSVWLNI